MSILPQLAKQDEVIVSDDGSTDDTLAVIDSIDDSRIVVFSNEGSHGVSSNFNNALAHASGDVFFLSDQDDIWIYGKVDKCLAALKDADMVVHNALLVGQDNESLGRD